MKIKFPELKNWTFIADEVSAGVYNVKGSDVDDRSLNFTGFDYDELLTRAKSEAIKMQLDVPDRLRNYLLAPKLRQVCTTKSLLLPISLASASSEKPAKKTSTTQGV